MAHFLSGNHGRYRIGRPNFVGALDGLGTGLESAWSVGRRLRAAYTGPIIRVRRSSDNVEQDFYPTRAGEVSPAEVAAFCGAGDGFLATIYGQSPLVRNLTQSTTTLQFQVVAGGVAYTQNGRLVAVASVTASRRMAVNGSTAAYNFLHTTGGTLYSVFQANDTAATKALVGSSNGSGNPGIRWAINNAEQHTCNISRIDSGGSAGSGNSVAHTATDLSSLAWQTASLHVDPDNATAALRSSIWMNGTKSTTDNGSTSTPWVENAGQNLAWGALGVGTFFDGQLAELVIWSGDQTANRAIWEDSAKAFWGTP